MAPFVNQLHPFRGAKDPGDRLVLLKELIEAGKLTPVIDKSFPLSEVPEAIRLSGIGTSTREARRHCWKVTTTIGPTTP
jgi:NADPH:quinone reductase-like Zn-dependent oxidoreductase